MCGTAVGIGRVWCVLALSDSGGHSQPCLWLQQVRKVQQVLGDPKHQGQKESSSEQVIHKTHKAMKKCTSLGSEQFIHKAHKAHKAMMKCTSHGKIEYGLHHVF